MQSSASTAWLPRKVANTLSQMACDIHNARVHGLHPKANLITGIVGDKTGTFETETRRRKPKVS